MTFVGTALLLSDLLLGQMLSISKHLFVFLSLGCFLLKTSDHVSHSLVTTSGLQFEHLSLDLLNNLGTTLLSNLHVMGHIRDKKSDRNLEANDDVLDEKSEEDDVSTVPESDVLSVEVLDED